MIFNKIKNTFRRNKKIITYIGLFLLLFSSGIDVASAGDTYTEQDAVNFIITIINAILGIISAVLGAVTAIVGWFLVPEWYNGKIFGLDGFFKEIWILVSNIVYFIFAVVLIVIAFMNIIGKGDKWELKQALPRFVVGVLIVPVSWFLVQFVLSLSAILTVSVLTLPIEIIDNNNLSINLDKIQGTQIDTVYELNLGSSSNDGWCYGDTSANGSTNLEGEILRSCDPEDLETIIRGEQNNGNLEGGLANSVFGLVAIYTYVIMALPEVDTLTLGGVDGGIKTIANLLQKGLFDIILIIVYTVLMIALFLALFVRGIMLWIYTIFSPAFGLIFFFGKSSDGVGDGNMKFSVKEFIALAMVPVYVSAALSFGFIFLLAYATGAENQFAQNDNCFYFGGVFEFCINGVIAEVAGNTIDTGLGTIGKLILKIFGIVILWIGVFAALKQSSITKSIVNPIEDFGKQVGGLVMKSPMYAPIIPTGKGGERMSMAGAKQVLSTAKTHFDSKGRGSGTKFMEKHGLFRDKLSQTSAAANAESAAKQYGYNQESIKEFKKAIKKIGSATDLANNEKMINSLKIMGEKAGLDKKLLEGLEVGNTSGVAEVIGALDKKGKGKKGYDLIEGSEESSGTFTVDKLNKYIKDNSDTKNNSTNDKTTEVLKKAAEVEMNGSNISLRVDGPYKMNATIDTGTSDFSEGKGKEMAQTLAMGIANNLIEKGDLEGLFMKMGDNNAKQLKKSTAEFLEKTDGGYKFISGGIKEEDRDEEGVEKHIEEIQSGNQEENQ